METSHMMTLIPVAFMFICALAFYRKFSLFLGIVGYCMALTWIAFQGHWEGLFFAAYLPIAAICLLGMIFTAIEGEMW